VLLLGYLVSYLYERGFKPKICKKGNKVNTIECKNGIVFRDICKLLSPSTNLRGFGKLFNLEQEKAHFPFSYLTSVEVLKEPSLPADPKHWISDLNSAKEPSKEDISHALNLFKAKNCKNIGEYLQVYLLLDVEILYIASQKWREALKSYVKLDFVEACKFTISSLANLAIGKSLSDRRHIGMFFPNNSQIYRLLREGMRGGLCQVFRSEAGGQHKREDRKNDFFYSNNAHLLALDKIAKMPLFKGLPYCCLKKHLMGENMRREKLSHCTCLSAEEKDTSLKHLASMWSALPSFCKEADVAQYEHSANDYINSNCICLNSKLIEELITKK